MSGLTPLQVKVLLYLDACRSSTSNIMRQVYGKPPTLTLRALMTWGYVTEELPRSPLSHNRRYVITPAGRRAAEAIRETTFDG